MCGKPFDFLFCGPNTRCRQTIGYFGKAIEFPELDGWWRGEYEGRIADEVSREMAQLILNPDTVPPGVSPLSGKPGKSWNAAMLPLFKRIREILATTGATRRALIITSAGNLQAIDQSARHDFEGDFDHKALAAKPYTSVTGKLFRLDGRSGMVEAKDNERPGIYMAEHGSSYFNFQAKRK